MWSYLVQAVAGMSAVQLTAYTVLALVLYMGIGIHLYSVIKKINKLKMEYDSCTKWLLICSWPVIFFFFFLVASLIVLAIVAVIALILGIIYAVISFIVSAITLILAFLTGVSGLVLAAAAVVFILATAIILCYFLICSPFVVIETIINGLKGMTKASAQTAADRPDAE